MDDLFKQGGHYPSDANLPAKCEACTEQNRPRDSLGHEHCRTGAEAAHRIYFKDRDKPLINRRKYIISRIIEAL